MKKILSMLRQTTDKYNMIEPGDKIAVAVSGGKDSLLLLEALKRYQSFSPVPFELGAIYIDIGFEKSNSDTIDKMCQSLSIPYICEKTVIKQVVFDNMSSKNPCSLCSRMRRAALCDIAKKSGYNKIALGHNRDDANETFMLNLLHSSKIECFEPKTLYEDIGITLIRPLIATPEAEIYSAAKRLNLPICEKICPADGKTDRENIKKLLSNFASSNRKVRENIFSAIQKLDIFVSKEKRD